jgi:hypothetical protein
MAGDPTRQKMLLELIEQAVSVAAGPMTPEAIALGTAELVPTPSAREIDVLLRILLPSLEPRDRDGAWALDSAAVEELLWPRFDELASRAHSRGQALGEISDPDAQDEGLWRFEELRALADRVESRTRRLVRDIDEQLHNYEEATVRESGQLAATAAERRERTDALLRAVLYKTHWGSRKLGEARKLLGIDILLLFATPAQALDLRPLAGASKTLSALDAEIDLFEAQLRAIIEAPDA